MKELRIKYNPYSLETEITVDGERPPQNSKLCEKTVSGTRLQEWIEHLPQILIDEYNVKNFNVTFHGTQLDYEDLAEALSSSELSVECAHIPAKETKDKEALIDAVFKEIQAGPFDELRSPEIEKAFRQAKNNEFEVVVVATISAGKSTLINSMLGARLMPSKAEACTAIITQIKDTGGENWKAEVFDRNGDRIKSFDKMNYKDMESLNVEEDVSMIKIEGNIPFIPTKEMSLVLVDTPGPGNARNREHEKKQWDYVSKSSKALVVYVTGNTYEAEYDQNLLRKIADSMQVGGKQSKDRFIFVVNKMDNRDTVEEPGDTERFLSGIRACLKEDHGIENPQLFPIVALPALNIRMIESGEEVGPKTKAETELKIDWLNEIKNMHYDEYATLPLSSKKRITEALTNAKAENDRYGEALIHTGVPSVEAAIRQYVEKYAKTAKIKNIVDTFMHKLEAVGCMEETKKSIAENRKRAEEIRQYIELIEKEIEGGKSLKTFEETVKSASDEITKKAKESIIDITAKYQKRMTKKIDENRSEKLSYREAQAEINVMYNFVDRLVPQFNSEMGSLIDNILIGKCKDLVNAYKEKLHSLTGNLKNIGGGEIRIDPLELMKAEIVDPDDFDLEDLLQTENRVIGTEYVKNTDKKWYKPWTWFQEDGYNRDITEDYDYIDCEELMQKYFSPIQEQLVAKGNSAVDYVMKQSKKIENHFREIFSKLDESLREKLNELKNAATEKDEADKRAAECEERLRWLEDIKSRVDSILEI